MVFIVKNHPLALPNCGGTILTEDRILTSAHCFFDENDEQTFWLDFEIVAGAHSFWVKSGNWQELKVYTSVYKTTIIKVP